MVKKIEITIVTFNSQRDIAALLDSLRAQSFLDFSVTIIDNASSDKTMEIVAGKYPEVKLIKNAQNKFFAPAVNQGIAATVSPYILLINPDMILAPDCLQNFADFINSTPNFGSVSGKLYQLKNGSEKSKTIDACGIALLPNFRVIELGSGEEDKEQYDNLPRIFGASGAFALYSRASLSDIAIENEIFDEDFLMYKEDVDVAYRLNLRGYQNYFVPSAHAWHNRKIAPGKNLSDREARQLKKNQPLFFRRLNYHNHLWAVVKNVPPCLFMKNIFYFLWYEAKKKLYILFFDWKTMPALFTFLKKCPLMFRKRKMIQQNRKITCAKLNELIIKAPR